MHLFPNLHTQFPNGSDHVVIACYLGLYEEGEVEHINGVRPSSLEITASWLLNRNRIRSTCAVRMRRESL